MSRDINDEDINKAAIAGLAALGIKIPGYEKYEERKKYFCGRCEKVMIIEELDCNEDDSMNYMDEALEVIHGEPTGLTGRYLDGDEWKEEIKNPDVSYANRKG